MCRERMLPTLLWRDRASSSAATSASFQLVSFPVGPPVRAAIPLLQHSAFIVTLALPNRLSLRHAPFSTLLFHQQRTARSARTTTTALSSRSPHTEPRARCMQRPAPSRLITSSRLVRPRFPSHCLHAIHASLFQSFGVRRDGARRMRREHINPADSDLCGQGRESEQRHSTASSTAPPQQLRAKNKMKKSVCL